jgi:PsbP
MSNILIFCTLAVALLSLISSISFTLAQEQQFTKYNDPEGKFTMDYPSDWYVNEEEPVKSNKDIVVQFDSSEPNIFGGTDVTRPAVWIMIRDALANETSLEKLSGIRVKTMTERLGPSVLKIGESGYSTLSGLRAYAIEYVLFGDPSKAIWTIYNGKVYEATYNAHSYDYDIYLPVFQQMVDSFHITK